MFTNFAIRQFVKLFFPLFEFGEEIIKKVYFSALILSPSLKRNENLQAEIPFEGTRKNMWKKNKFSSGWASFRKIVRKKIPIIHRKLQLPKFF